MVRPLLCITICLAGVTIPACAPQPQPVDVAQIAAGLSEFGRSASIQPTTFPYAEPSPDVESLLRANAALPAGETGAGQCFVFYSDRFKIIGLEHRGVFLVTADGTIMVLVPEWEVLKQQGMQEGILLAARASQPKTGPAFDKLEANLTRFILNMSLADGTVKRIPERLAAELGLPSSTARREPLIRVAVQLLRGKIHLSGRTNDGMDLSRDLELDPVSRQKVFEAMLKAIFPAWAGLNVVY